MLLLPENRSHEEGLSSISEKISKDGIQLKSAANSPITLEGYSLLNVSFDDKLFTFKFYIVKNLVRDCILGVDFMNMCEVTFTFGKCLSITTESNQIITEIPHISDIPCYGNDNLILPVVSNFIKPLIDKFKKLFNVIPGTTKEIYHKIQTKSDQICKEAPRQVPIHYRSKIQNTIDNLLKNNIIRESSSPYCAPVVFVPKKDGDIRICVDYRRLNNITKKNAYPIPFISDIQNKLKGANIFSTIDLKSGYWQIPIDPQDREKTAFSFGAEYGLFEFNVMPFGLTGAPGTFQRLMNRLLINLSFVFVYLDDIIIFSENEEEHYNHLNVVLTIMLDAGLTINPEKSKFAISEIEYLGYVFSSEGMKLNPSTIKSIMNYPKPQNGKEVQKFLGFANYYRRFIEGFAHIAKPLYVIADKDESVVFDIECENAFTELKKRLTSPPVLNYPDPNTNFEVYTDASNIALGAILEQNGRPIAYSSRVLKKAEINYSAYELECAAIIFALKQYRQYLLGKKFKLFCDHEPLRWVLENKTRNGKVGRWILQLQEFDFEICYRKGVDNVNADTLSRISCLTEMHPLLSMCQMREAQTNDEELKIAYKLAKKISFKIDENNKTLVKRYKQISSQLKIVDEILYREYSLRLGDKPALFVIVPKNLRMDFLNYSHDSSMSGHGCYEKTLERLRNMCYWPGIYQDTAKYCQSCVKCSMASTRKQKIPLTPMTSNTPWDAVSIDILELNQSGGFRYVLAIQDYFTKWMIARPLENQTAEAVSTEMIHVFSQYGVPRKIHSDQGRNFESWAFKQLCQAFGVEKSRTTSYHPQGNGLVERANRSIINILRKIGNTYEWHKILPLVSFIYNTAKHSTIQVSPYEALYGRPARNCMWDPNNKIFDFWTNFYGVQLNRAKIHDLIETELNLAADKQKAYFDGNNNVENISYKTGQKVYRLVPRSHKIDVHWEKGWEICEDTGSTVKIINKESGKSLIVNKDKIKLMEEREMEEKTEVDKWEFPQEEEQEKNDRYPTRWRKRRELYGSPYIDLPNHRGRNVIDNYIDTLAR